MAEGNKALYYTGGIIIVALALTYVFWSIDLIPDAASAVGITTFIGWVDDAVALGLMVLALRRWKVITMGTKGQPSTISPLYSIIFISIVILGLAYVFWIVDLIPDSIPYIGWMDDALVIITGFYILAKIKKKLKA